MYFSDIEATDGLLPSSPYDDDDDMAALCNCELTALLD